MSKLDITFWKLILVGGGLIIVIAMLCLLLDEWFTGFGGWLPAWARCLIVLAALGVILLALAAKVRR